MPPMPTTARGDDMVVGAQIESPTKDVLSTMPANRFKTVPVPSLPRRILNYTHLSVRYTAADIISRPRNTCIGVFAVFLVVFFSGLIITATSKTPYLLLRFAEIQAGEMDAMLLADDGLPFINYTRYAPMLQGSSSIAGVAPRWLAKGNIINWQEERAMARRNESERTPLNNVSTNILVIDSMLEKQIGVGRGWPYREIGYAETQVYNSALRFIHVRPNVGERLRLYLDLQGLLETQGMPTDAFDVTISGLDAGEPNTTALQNAIYGFNFTNVTVDNITIPGSVVRDIAFAAANASLSSILNQTVEVNVLDLIPTSLKLTVADSIANSQGKYPSLLGNVAIMDYRQLLEMVTDQACLSGGAVSGLVSSLSGGVIPDTSDAISDAIDGYVDRATLTDFALIIVALFEDRYNMYYASSKERTRRIIRASNAMMLSMGLEFGGVVQYTLASALDAFSYFQLFIDSVFITIVVVIIVLGSLLVYMLLVTNSEERQFEVAMIRAQGMCKPQLLHLMITQTAAFVIPGIGLGIGMLFLVNAIVEYALEGFTKAPAEPTRISTAGVVVACVVGVVMPIAANWRPAMAAMATSLREALSIYRQRATETQVTMIKLEELGLAPWQILLGLFLTVAGFAIYYLVPLSFIYNNLYMFFILMDFIVLTMIFGLCLLTYTIQGLLQKGLLFVILRPFEWHMWTLITRNLRSHKERNALTFMMFNISVSCIVFAGVLFSMLSGTLTATVKISNGADVTVTSSSYDTPLDRDAISNFLDTQSNVVEAYAFSTFALRDVPQTAENERYSSIVSDARRSSRIRTVGVDENFQDVVYEDYILWTEVDEGYSYSTTHGRKDVIRNMYAHPSAKQYSPDRLAYTGYPANYSVPDVQAKYDIVLPCVMAAGVETVIGLTAGSSGVLEYTYELVGKSQVESLFLVQPRALAQKVSGFAGISSQQFGVSSGDVLITVPAYQQLLRANDTDFGEAPSARTALGADADWTPRFERVFIRLRSGVSKDDRTDFVNYLQAYVNPYYHTPADTADIISSVQAVADLIMYFFFFVGAVAIALDAVMLWLAFVSNVRSQAWSFGVLRSLGFRVWQLVRAYLYEAIVVTFSAFITGTVIGVLVAYTLMTQMTLFLDMPVKFAFPYALYFFLFGLSIVAAFAGSILPVWSISKQPIASVIKGM